RRAHAASIYFNNPHRKACREAETQAAGQKTRRIAGQGRIISGQAAIFVSRHGQNARGDEIGIIGDADTWQHDSHDFSPDERYTMEASQMVQGLPSKHEIWGWHEKLAGMGTRYTGSPGHAKFINWLKKKFSEEVPNFKVNSDPLKLDRWLAEPEDCSLSISQDPAVGPSESVPITYYYPYSGKTGPGGITCRLVDLGEYAPAWYSAAFWARATGEIALVRVPPCTFTLDVGQLPTGGFEPGQLSPDSPDAVVDYLVDAELVTNPVFQTFATVPLLD